VQRVFDPYRELGVARGASDAQIKAAHRRLAKRHHPDADGGDQVRFLAIQEAYLLLSDPLRRREWDARHAPGPVRATEPGRPRSTTGRPRPRARKASPMAEASTSAAPSGAAGSAGDRRAGAPRGKGRPAQEPWRTADRDPASRSHTWSAAGVPWWEDFRPRGPGRREEAAAPAKGTRHGRAPEARSATGDFDVYSRSSGAAWSMAARRYFRRGDADLPSGGSFRTRGTQVVTGAEARRVAEEERLFRARAGVVAAPRAPFEHAPASAAPPPTPGVHAAAPSAPRPADPATVARAVSEGFLERVQRLLGRRPR
jgi:molecular chaperone DnaJ